MTLSKIGLNSIPAYIAVSADIEDNGTITGASNVGKTVYLTDLQEYRLILPNLKLIPFAYENGTSGVEPEYDSSEIGNEDDTTVAVTFNENILAPDYALGVTIKVNGVVQEIESATRQTDHAIVFYVIADAVIEDDVVTWEYNSVVGGIQSETGYVYMENVSPQTVTNNVV